MYFTCLVFTASGDGTIRAFNTKSGSCKRVYKGHEHAVNALVVSSDIVGPSPRHKTFLRIGSREATIALIVYSMLKWHLNDNYLAGS